MDTWCSTPIQFSSDHDLDEQLHKGAHVTNSRAQWIGEHKCKVETCEMVIKELEDFALQCRQVTLEVPKCEGDPSEPNNDEPSNKYACFEFTLG